jgi:Peptidase family C25
VLSTLLSISFFGNSQRFGNEWIINGQEYLKITVNKNGIYRINKADLTAQTFNTTGKLLKNYQLFHRGQEIAVKVIGNPETEIQTSDYIYFYGIANDGAQDADLYKHGATRPNPYFSLYSDNTAYFLTVGTSVGKRMDVAPAANAALPNETHYISKILDNQINNYNHDIQKAGIPSVVQSYFEPYEGMVSFPYFGKNGAGTRPLNKSYTLTNFLSGTTTNISFETTVTTRTNSGKTMVWSLEKSTSNEVAGTFTIGSHFTGYKLNTTLANITGTLDLALNSNGATDKDFWSYFYALIKYPTSPIFVDNKEYELTPNATNISKLNLTTGPAGNIFGFDITDIANQKEINLVKNGTNLEVYVNNTVATRKIYLASATTTPKSLTKVIFTPIDQSLYDYIILTDKRLTVGATAYKNYKESAAGGAYKVHLAYISDIYDQFSYGERTPNAIHKYADYMTSTPKVMKYLFIIGKSISVPSHLKLYYSAPTQTFASPNLLAYPHADNPEDYVPTIGYPASDIALTSGLLGTLETVPAIPTGRLIVTTDTEIQNYLTKVIEHATRPSSTYQKNLIGIVGPQHGSEKTTLHLAMKTAMGYAKTSAFAADTLTLNKPVSVWNNNLGMWKNIYDPITGDYTNLTAPKHFYKRVTDGVGIMAYYGHGSSDEVAYNISFVSKETSLTDATTLAVIGADSSKAGGPTRYLDMATPKYSLFIGSGCGLSNSFFVKSDGSYPKDMASDWVNTPKKGSINAISNTSLSYETYDTRALEDLFRTMFGNAPSAKKGAAAKRNATNQMLNSAIGDIFKQSSINSINENLAGTADPNAVNADPYYVSNLQQTILLGDPSIAIFKSNITQPLSLTLLDVKAVNESKKTVISWETENEVDFDGFDVEKSFDSNKFVKIGHVKGSGSANEQNYYSFDDLFPNEGVNYYRLKMIDLDGKTSYSKIVSTKFEVLENSLKVSGNPVINNQFNFHLNNFLNNTAQLTDLRGNKISIETSNQGENNYIVTIKKSIPKGVYVFGLYNMKGTAYSQKIIIE